MNTFLGITVGYAVESVLLVLSISGAVDRQAVNRQSCCCYRVRLSSTGYQCCRSTRLMLSVMSVVRETDCNR